MPLHTFACFAGSVHESTATLTLSVAPKASRGYIAAPIELSEPPEPEPVPVTPAGSLNATTSGVSWVVFSPLGA
jgi:hypothetical protein